MTGGEDHKRQDEELTEEMRRIEAAQAVLKRKGLDFLEQLRTEGEMHSHLSVRALFNNEDFLKEVDAVIEAEAAPDPGGVRRFLADFAAQVESLDARWLLTLWRQTSGQSGGNFDSLLQEYGEIYTPDLLQKLESMSEIADVAPPTQRRLNLWCQVTERELIDVDLESQRMNLRQFLVNYRFQLQNESYIGSETLLKLLREEKIRELRLQAWRRLVSLSKEIEPQIRELFLETNALWQQQGYQDAFLPKLQFIGISEPIFREVITSIEMVSRPAAHAQLNQCADRLGHEVEQHDWHFLAGMAASPFKTIFNNLHPIKTTKTTYQTLGIDIEQKMVQYAYDSPSQKIISYPVRVPHDIILCHWPLQGYWDYFALFNALGGANYFAHIDGDLPYAYRRHAYLVVREGFATLSSWLLWEPRWLKEVPGLSSSQITEFLQMKEYELLKLRYNAAMALFEMDAYQALARDPEADVNGLYRQCMERFLLVPTNDCSVWTVDQRLMDPQGRPIFANYVLGLAIAANLLEIFHKEGESLYSPRFGTLFTSGLVRQGSASSWREQLQQLTAKSLTPFPLSWAKT